MFMKMNCNMAKAPDKVIDGAEGGIYTLKTLSILYTLLKP